mmetsp:Transcript_12475/g.29734  ORF Transcript_12475/g.29734 Transcript_12475/m.29734 type:complete len:362 (+) Transcript_12475:56-1141(+)
MTPVRLFGALVLGLTVTMGVIGKTKPEVFLQLPMGFIPWAMTGNPMPPFFDTTPFEDGEFRSWARDGDLIVSAGAKSGTNWMLYCAHQIRSKGRGNFTDVLLDTPWVELVVQPGQQWAEIKEKMNSTILPDGSNVKDYWDHPSFPFRIFKSHVAPPVAPVTEHKKVKYLAMSRNGMDVVRSFYPFFAAHRPEFKARWGGFPPTYSDPMACLKDFLPGGTLEALYFGYVKAWWPHRHDPNVLLVHYSDAKADLAATVTKVAQFVGVDLDAAEHAEVTRKCDIEHMKTIADKFDYVQWAGTGERIMCGKGGCPGVDGRLIRSGQNGEGAAFFSDEMKELWEAAVQSELKDPDLRRWAAEGGGY